MPAKVAHQLSVLILPFVAMFVRQSPLEQNVLQFQKIGKHYDSSTLPQKVENLYIEKHFLFKFEFYSF